MRYKSLLAATGLAVSGVVVSGLAVAQPVQAAPTTGAGPTAGTCSITLPARIYIGSPSTDLTVKQKQDCIDAGVKQADWRGTQNGDEVTEFIEFLNYSRSTKLTLKDDVAPIGTVIWSGHGAQTAGGDDIAQKSATHAIKYDSWGNVVATKSGSTVSVTAQIGCYVHKENRYVRWPNKTGILQYAEKGSTVWHNLASFKTNSKGEYTVKYKPGKVRQYRLYVYESPSVWWKLTGTKTV